MEGYLIRLRDLVVHAEIGKWDRVTLLCVGVFIYHQTSIEELKENFRKKRGRKTFIKYFNII